MCRDDVMRYAVALSVGLAVVPGVAAGPTVTTVTWQAAGGVWSGNYTNAAHWAGGVVPDALKQARVVVPSTSGFAVTNTFPDGVFETRASQCYSVPSATGSSFVWNGTNTSFRMPGCDTENYKDEPFRLEWTGTQHFFNFQTYSDQVDHWKHAIARIDNGLFRITAPRSSDDALHLDFNQGTFNFYDPDGTARTTPYFRVGHNDYNRDVAITFHPGVTMTMPGFVVANELSSGRTLLFDINGARVSAQGITSLMPNDTYTAKTNVTQFVVTNGASLVFGGVVNMGAKTATPATYDKCGNVYPKYKSYRFDVADGGLVAFSNTLNQTYCGDTFLTVRDGGTLRFGGTASFAMPYARAALRVGKGGLLDGAGVLRLGAGEQSAADLLVDGGTVAIDTIRLGLTSSDTATSSFVMTNGASVTTTCFYLGRGAVDVTAGMSWLNRDKVYTGFEHGEESYLNVHPGGVLRTGDLVSGVRSGIGTLNMNGGTVVCTNALVLGSNESATGVVNLVSGAVTRDPASGYGVGRILVGVAGGGVFNMSGGALTNTAVYVPYNVYSAKCGNGAFNMSGGEMNVINSLGVGYGGNGTFDMSGGHLTTLYLFLGQTSCSSPDAWATFRQTGGLVDITTADNDLGVKMADNATRKSRLILDGGVMRVMHIFGHVGARCRGGTGYAALSANGGTIRVVNATSRLIYTLDEAKVGPRGLTIDAQKDCTIEQDFTDADDAAGQGRLILAGSAQKTLSATNGSCSFVVAAGGTTRFAPNGDAQAVQDSSLIVTNGATVSLVGAQTSLAIRDLTVGDDVSDGRLAFDPTDTLTVTGTLTINRGVLEVNGSLTAGADYEFLVLEGDRREALKDAWARLLVVSTADPDAYHAANVTYDADTGKTKIVVQKIDTSAAFGTAVWTGATDGAWATAGNWQAGVQPGLMTRAAFDSETATNVIALAQAERTAGLAFAADRGYTLAGGTLVVTPHPETALAVAKGTNTIASDLVSQERAPVSVASRAALAVTGNLTAGTLVKTGPGALTLAGGANNIGSVTLSNGTLAVSAPAALGGAATLMQTDGTLALGGGTDDACAAYPTAVSMKSPAGTTNVFAWRVTGNVAMAAPTVFYGAGGLFYKHGAGRLTWAATAANTPLASTDGRSGDWKPELDGSVTLDEDGNVTPTTDLAGFNVGEGEMVLTKGAEGASFKTETFITVGRSQTGAREPAHLIVDGVSVNASTSGKHVLLGPRLTAENTSLDASHFTMRNGAYLLANTYYVGRESQRTNYAWHTYVDASTIECTYGLQANAAVGTPDTMSYLTFTNGAACRTPVVSVPARATFVFDRSELTGRKGAACLIRPDFNFAGNARSGGDFLFRNASYLKCSGVTVYGWPERPTTLTFDNAEWDPASADFTLVVNYPASLQVKVENTGLVLAPAAGETWRIAHAVSGTGGLVKRGAGTLAFVRHRRVDPTTRATNDYDRAATTLDFTGTAAVEEGTLKIASGAAAAGAAFRVAAGAVLDFDGATAAAFSVTGLGTVSNATMTATTLPVTVSDAGAVTSDLPVFDTASVTFGRTCVDFARSAENPLALPFGPVVVGRYSGTAPSTDGWRVAHTGICGVRGVFTAENGEVSVTLKRVGFSIILR